MLIYFVEYFISLFYAWIIFYYHLIITHSFFTILNVSQPWRLSDIQCIENYLFRLENKQTITKKFGVWYFNKNLSFVK